METVFLRLVNMSITAGWLILAVVLLRPLLRRAPKAVRCLLWGLVGLRLLCPVSPVSMFSLIPSVETVPTEILHVDEPMIHSGIAALNMAVNPVLSDALAPSRPGATPAWTVTHTLAIVWLAGAVLLLLYCVCSYVRLRRRVSMAVRLRENIWQSERVMSPFVLGLFRPRIYLPFGLDEESISLVVAHERAHICRRDHWLKPLGFLLLAVYWFNPLLWLAYSLFCRDLELACDERVLRRLGPGGKKAYSAALLACSVHRRDIALCPVAFGEIGVKTRVKHILHYKRPAFWVIVLALVACTAVAVCFLTNPKEEERSPFGATYYVAEILYDAPQYSFTYTEDSAPHYSLSADRRLLEKGGIGGESWLEIGTLTEVSFKTDTFAALFMDAPGSGFSAEQTAKRIRRVYQAGPEENANNISCLVLEMEGGELLLAYGYDDGAQASVRWLFRLEPYTQFAAGVYAFDTLLYVNPLSSAYYGNGTGQLYFIGETSFILADEESREERAGFSSLQWSGRAVTDAAWEDLFVLEPVDISGYRTRLRYDVSAQYSLFLMDDELWLAEFRGEERLWSLYKLKRTALSLSDLAGRTGPSASGTPGQAEKRTMTLDDVCALAEKGDALTWNELDAFAYSDVGSGRYIYVFPIHADWQLVLNSDSGFDRDAPVPISPALVYVPDGSSIALWEEDVAAFILAKKHIEHPRPSA